MDDKQMACFRRLTIRIEKATRAAGFSSRMSNKRLIGVMIDAKIMNKKHQFLDEDGNVITFI